ncbi:MAG: VOC family protein, partial [Candidatus Dormibacteraeota bacterium]|nr:VOC family protein [Candidatus Dormibacteraeota bacterium]
AGRPRLAFDHVQIAVPDLMAAAADLRRRSGLVAVAGGRHPGRGTANMIVPLGNSYLELIAVVDAAEAAVAPTSTRVANAVAEGRRFAVWVARTDDLDAARNDLVEAGWALPPIAPGARVRPDGRRLEWRMQELVADAAPSPLPFLIEWKLEADLYPGAVPAGHPGRAASFRRIRLTAAEPEAAAMRLRVLLGDDLDWTLEPGPAGVSEIELEHQRGPIRLA